ncbi:putative PEP-CTERM system histidine kinase [Humitalea rosea]|uniref:histidine kinase n=1 Tax=Humitalea rosea TaxID=990373 RepID=A0A2W7ILA9_9PROT|nr:XrtA/PEP-CTERM system histidine kinase PrsK [Humitalea rosea]PZW46787.1 putative PEP-CTERM system histidine kinase [Humitalea rosea]
MTGAASTLLHAGCAVICAAWTVLILCAGRGRTALLLAATGAVAALWAAAVALAPEAPLEGPAGLLEVVRSAVWFAVLLLLCVRIAGAVPVPLVRRFGLIGLLVTAVATITLLPGTTTALAVPTLSVLARLALALLVVLMAENLYRNAPEAARWHVVLPCIALGGLAAFDVLLYADAALSRDFSTLLIDARAVLTAMAAPLLAIAAVRDRRSRRDLPVSRQLVFHGATLVVAGTFLLGIGAAGEALRQFGDHWARAAQIGIMAGALMALAVAVTARSVRSRLRRLVVDHFFVARYDYRREWLQCIARLSAPDAEVPADIRAIRAIADPADSPAGILLLRNADGHDADAAPMRWAGSWNGPSEPLALAPDHPLIAAMRHGAWVAHPGPGELADLRAVFGPLWLAVPLMHHREGLLGAVLLARPRAGVILDSEVFDLLRMLGREVAMFLAERRGAERLTDQERLQAYAKRFAFVAHDVKTVATQLTLLLANADANIQDPEFQQDMLLTVRAAADRINTLIARLRAPEDAPAPASRRHGAAERGSVEPLPRLRRLAAGRGCIRIEADGDTANAIAMPPDVFDAAVTHLLDNAVEASAPGAPVRIHLRQEGREVVVDITDQGEGMTPAFIRDELFRPLTTSKPSGNGIGAWQARELVRQAGGDLAVFSKPGLGTTMRIILPLQPVPVAVPDGREGARLVAVHAWQ